MAFLFCPGSSFSKKPKFLRPRRKTLPTNQKRPDPPSRPLQLPDRQESHHQSRQILCSVSDLASRSPTLSDGGDSGCGFRSQQSSASSGECGGHALPPTYFPAQSGYATDESVSFESKLLQRATPSSPANLKMTVIRDYAPCCNEELAVRKGQRVKVLYRRNDWAFAVTKNGAQGYIPYSYCRLSRRYSYARTDVEESGNETDSTVLGPEEGRPFGRYRYHQSQHHLNGYVSCSESFPPPQHQQNHHQQHRRSPVYVLPADCKPRMVPFHKDCIEELVVIHDFMGREENELLVAKGERVKVLNADDQEWLWVSTIPGDEGFVPRSCLSFGTHPALQRCETNRQAQLRRCVSTERLKQKASMAARSHVHHHHHHIRQGMPRVNKHQAKERFKQLAIARQQRPIVNNNKEEIKKIGSQLIVLADYDAHEVDELSVQLADMLLADMIPQSNADRLWAYNTRTDKLGFIPNSLVQPPVV